MAVLPAPPLVSADDYLKSSYHPDHEYVDGVLVERSVPSFIHGLLQVIIAAHFHALRKQFGFIAVSEVRTQIVAGARYRIPDVMLCPHAPAGGNIVTFIPWAIIEILSPDDKMHEMIVRFRDYSQVGVCPIVLLDPETLTAFRFQDGSLLRTEFKTLDLPTGAVPFDSDALFKQLTEELGRE